MNNLITRAKEESKTDIELIILSIVSATLASLGIALNDNFIIIASMLIAPFLEPMISFVVLFKAQNLKGIINSVRAFFVIFVIGAITSSIVFYLLSLKYDFENVSYFPKTNFEYFIIAIILGAVGMLLWIWPKMSNTSAGLAIAISLMPPLANVGRSIILLNSTKFFSSVGSFFINVIGIIIGAMLVLFLKKSK